LARSLVLEGPRILRLQADDPPVLGPRDVRVRAALSGISHGTELSLYRGTSGFADRVFDRELRAFVPPDPLRSTYPAPLGYELVGVLAEAGAEVDELAVGDLVHAGVPHREEVVLDLDATLGTTYPLVRLPAGVPQERWLFVSLGMVALVAAHDARVKVGDHVAVIGLGAIGLLMVQLAKMAGAARVTGVDLVAARRELAQGVGADAVLDPREAGAGIGPAIKRAGRRGVDVAVETSGSTVALHDAIAAAGLGGRVVTVGFYQGGAPGLRLGEEWHHNRLEMVSSMGAWGAPHRAYPAWDRLRVARTVVDLLASGRLEVDAFPIRRFPFDDAAEAYVWLDAHPDEAMKVALTYEGSNPERGGGAQ
jgi:2-desacetyl-2-hydroxyethyl bacteriochlorophyllide A dehydrogenase